MGLVLLHRTDKRLEGGKSNQEEERREYRVRRNEGGGVTGDRSVKTTCCR